MEIQIDLLVDRYVRLKKKKYRVSEKKEKEKISSNPLAMQIDNNKLKIIKQ